MFGQDFNPEFHWQMNQKKITHKKILIIFLVLLLLLSIFLIFKKYYFVSGRSINLAQLVPDNTKAVLEVSTSDIVKNEQGSLILRTGLKDFLNNDNEVSSLIESLGKNIYWMEESPDSQSLLFKMIDIESTKDIFNLVTNNSKDIKFNGKIIYELNLENIDNPFLPISESKGYITYLNDYIFCISNNLSFTKNIIDKYKEATKIDYFGAIKDELSSYFQEQTTLLLKVSDYSQLKDSSSWIKNLSFITEGDNSDSFVIKFRIGLGKAELLFNDSNNLNQKISMNRMSGETFNDDAVIHYSNLNVNYNDLFELSNNIDIFLQNNIEGLYNTNLKSKLFSNSPYHILVYPDNKFLAFSKDSEKMKSIYKNILAHLLPQTREMILPDGTSATEYYADSNAIVLQEQENQGIIWYYDDLPGNIDIYLAQYQDWYILTNSRDKLVELSENQDKFCELLNCNNKNSFNEILSLDLGNFSQKEYLPWLNLFSKSYNRLNFINLTEDGENKLFFELIH